MDGKVIFLDTSILIDYFRKQNKRNSKFYQLSEIYIGADGDQKPLWDNMFKRFKVIPLDEKSIFVAVDIFKNLRKKNKLIEVSDIFIAATAKANNLKVSTNNKKR